MPDFKIRTTAPDYSNPNYPHGISSEGQCTYGCYYRCKEIDWPAPCYNYKGNPGYGNAKDWPENIAKGWEAHYVSKEPNYIPVPGDICVFNGSYGHVIFIEDYKDVDKQTYLISQWNKDSDCKYSSDIWHLGDRIQGKKLPTGPVKAYLHYECNNPIVIEPVEEDKSVDQLEVISDRVYMRIAPSTSGTKYPRFAPVGFYNIYSIAIADGYTWVKVSEDDIWIAVIDQKEPFSTVIRKAVTEDNQEAAIELLKSEIKKADETNARLVAALSEIKDICEANIK